MKAILVASLILSLSGCGAGENDPASGSGSVSASSLVGTWINSSGNQSWTFSGSGTSGTGEYRTASSNPTGTCDIIYVSYHDVNLSSGTFQYNGTGEEWTGNYPVPYKASISKTYNSTVRINGSTATIEGTSFTRGNKAC